MTEIGIGIIGVCVIVCIFIICVTAYSVNTTINYQDEKLDNIDRQLRQFVKTFNDTYVNTKLHFNSLSSSEIIEIEDLTNDDEL